MSRKDIIHAVVLQALINAGWVITDDALRLRYPKTQPNEVDFEVDIGAKKNDDEIAIEVKSFITQSIPNYFHGVMGQYLNYRDAMSEINMNRDLYLAISDDAYYDIQKIPFILRRNKQYEIKLIIVDLDNQKAIKWIK